jgi:hypothetical protein
VTKQLREYAFDATTSVGSTQSTRSHINGRLVRDQGLAYEVVVGKKRTKVVRLRHVTYVRQLPGEWAKLRKRTAIVNPTASLLALLRGITPTERRLPGDGGAVLRGTVRPAAAQAAGLPDSTGAIRALVSMDKRRRVVALIVRIDTVAGDSSVAVSIQTTYGRFGAVPAIRRPV